MSSILFSFDDSFTLNHNENLSSFVFMLMDHKSKICNGYNMFMYVCFQVFVAMYAYINMHVLPKNNCL